MTGLFSAHSSGQTAVMLAAWARRWEIVDSRVDGGRSASPPTGCSTKDGHGCQSRFNWPSVNFKFNDLLLPTQSFDGADSPPDYQLAAC